MSISCMGGNSGFRIVKSIDAAPNGLESWNYTNVEHLYAAAARLKRVQIENRDYVALLHDYDHPSALLYLDPPYVHSTRVSKKEYTQEWSDRDHTALADIARNAKGYVIVSGYACNLYQELYERFGWQRIDRDSRGNTGSKRVESLWLSPKTWEETHGKHSQLSLFELL